ncbi:hypothetical protein MLD38_035965 [Melastoma candidum]|uniref:Uncharacterized protein n=1 Tax=Melastoma candidum TaxID=119954 RepID=A0ACB9LIW1_9MYRT|nr:hypothetical protein MLD38_035965 [Melastoma candidum]
MMVVDSVLGDQQGTEKKGKLSVLIVDDDPIARRVCKMLLKNADAEAEADVAVNGMEAVNLCATKKLREIGLKSVIVGVTSHASEPEIARAFMEAGLDELYGKPLTANVVKSLIRNKSDQPKPR